MASIVQSPTLGTPSPPDAARAPAALPLREWVDRLARFQQSAALAYVTIVLLQMHRIWDMWNYRDLTTGDTTQYFLDAWKWHEGMKVNIAWSPLYTAFYGSMLRFTSDAYAATILHRMVIVLAATVLVLAIMRRLLPASLAWLAAAWWAVLPINFDTLYEVHLFALLPIAVAWLIALRTKPGAWSRAAVLGIFLIATFLVRNEMSVPSGVFALVCLIIELRERKKIEPSHRRQWTKRTIAIYVGTFAVVVGIIVGCYSISTKKYPELSRVLRVKHTLNMAQVFAFGYQQRHPQWTLSPWTDCGKLCKSVFDNPSPSLWEMVRANPRAWATHVLWNLSLVPSGWQILMFDAASGSVNPDYAPQQLGQTAPIYESLAVIAVVLAGAVVWFLERRKWRQWFADRGLGWWAMLAVLAVSPLVVITQRPRPSYFFTFSVFTIAVVGTAVWILVRRFRTARFEWIVMLPVMLLGWMFVSSAYPPAPRPVHDDYEHMATYAQLIARGRTRLLAGNSPAEMHSYIGHGRGAAFGYELLFPEWKGQTSLAKFFDSKELNMVYIDDFEMRMFRAFDGEALNRFITTGGSDGWLLLACGREPDRWMLFERTATPTAGPTWDPERPPMELPVSAPSWITPAGHESWSAPAAPSSQPTTAPGR